MTLLRRIVCVSLFLVAALIATRFVGGPIDHPIAIHSPLNLEAWFAVCGILLILIRERNQLSQATPTELRASDFLLATAVGITAILAVVRMRESYFLSDDFVLLRHAAAPSTWRSLFATRGADGFFRPVGYLSIILAGHWAHIDPARWHWIGFIMHALNTAMVFLLALMLGHTRLPALTAAAVFGLHGASAEAVVWMAARFDLLGTCAFLLALLLLIASWTANPPARWLWQTGSLPCLLVANLTKESTYVFPLVAALLVLCYRDRFPSASLTRLAPWLAVTGAVFAYRWWLYGGIAGYSSTERQSQALSIKWVSSVNALGFRMWGILAFPINWTLSTRGLLLAAVGLFYLVALGILFVISRSSRSTWFALGFTLISALPVLTLLLIGVDLEKTRVLYLPTIGFGLLLGSLLQSVRPRVAVALAAAIILFHAVALQRNLDAWTIASRAVRASCVEAAKCANPIVEGMPRTLHGVNVFPGGFQDCIAMQNVEPSKEGCRLHWDSARERLTE